MKAIIRKDEQAVSPVIATILMVAITVVLAAVLYVMVSGLLTGPGPSKPIVAFGALTRTGTTSEQFQIASASPQVGPSNFKVNVGIGPTLVGAVAFPATSGSAATDGNTTITWLDVGGEKTVNQGDIITVTWASSVPSGMTITFYLLYSDGSTIQTQAWQM